MAGRVRGAMVFVVAMAALAVLAPSAGALVLQLPGGRFSSVQLRRVCERAFVDMNLRKFSKCMATSCDLMLQQAISHGRSERSGRSAANRSRQLTID